MHAPAPQEKWYWFCDQCGVAVQPRTRGKELCRSCRFPIYVKPRRGKEPLVDGATAMPFPTTLLPDAACSDHPGHPALGLCERCGNCLCAPCVRLVEGRLYCAACVPYLGRRFKRRVLKHQGVWWAVLGVIGGLLILMQVAAVVMMLVFGYTR